MGYRNQTGGLDQINTIIADKTIPKDFLRQFIKHQVKVILV